MVVKIRLARFGRKREPIFNIVVSQARTARNSKPMEVLGTYDPRPRVPLATANAKVDAIISTNAGVQVADQITGLPRQSVRKHYKAIELDQSRTKYWLGVGAQPSEPVERLLCLIGLMEHPPGTMGKRPAVKVDFPTFPTADRVS